MNQEPLLNGLPRLKGGALLLAAWLLALGNFMAVLDMTIANVAVPTISGSLGITSSQGTWIITSYSVAEAITVPLTGWLSARFGSVRVITVSMFMFGITSLICGLANSFPLLIIGRILQGLSGGPMMPLAQTLLMRIFPREKIGMAMGLWAVTTLVAPVTGPILGGYICDNFRWEFAFLINVPIAMAISFLLPGFLSRYEMPLEKKAIDFVGLALLVLWVGALQIMLDIGKEHDWFASTEVLILLGVSIIGFIAFLIWELTEKNPIVDLRVFRHRGYTTAVTTLIFAFGSFFAINVLNPLWLQGFMGYTSGVSGLATAGSGILAIFTAPLVGRFGHKFDARLLVFMGVSWMAFIAFVRSFGTTDMTFMNVATPILMMGIGMPLFFIPLSGLALQAVETKEAESAAGLMSFLRTFAGAVAVSIVTTLWDHKIRGNYARLAGEVDKSQDVAQMLGAAGQSDLQIALVYSKNLMNQAVMIATNEVFFLISLNICIGAALIWLVPKPDNNKAAPQMAH